MVQLVTVSIDPDTTSGNELAFYIGQNTESFLTAHSGTQRPSYAKPFTNWLDVSVPEFPVLKVYDGQDDVVIGTLDLANNTFRTSGAITYGGGAGLTQSGTDVVSLDVGQGVGLLVTADAVAVDRSVVDTWYAAAGHNHDSDYLGINAQAKDSALLAGVPLGAAAVYAGSDVVRRDSSGDIHARYIRTNAAEQTNTPAAGADICFRNNTSTDNYFRFMSQAAIKDYLGLPLYTMGSNSNGYYRVWADGFIEQWGQYAINQGIYGWNSLGTKTYPIAFTSSIETITVSATQDSFNYGTAYHARNETLSNAVIYGSDTGSGGTRTGTLQLYLAGY